MTSYPLNFRQYIVTNRRVSASLVIVTLSHLLCCNNLSTSASETIDHVTCGSVIKLENEAKPEVRLHSHDIKYGSGSGQQSVTAVENQDTNSYWSILGEKNKHCNRGEPIECGSTIRLQHVQTRKYLHSHLFKSPLSSQQEVSAFGNDSDSDTGDHWMVYCRSRYWQKNESIRLKHVDTGMWLSLSGNIYGRPIFGQLEVVCSTNPESSSNWKTAEGVYVHPTATSETVSKHDEL